MARRSVPGAQQIAMACSLLAALLATPAFSQSSSNSQRPPDILDGTLSGKGDLEEDARPKFGHFRFPTALEPWFALKNQLRQDYGIAIGGSYGVLWQNYSNSLIDQHNAVGGKFTLNIGAQLLNRGRPDAMWLEAVVEDRRPLGTKLAPLQAGIGTGAITVPAATWGDFDIGVTQFYLRQNLFDNHLQWAVGKIFAPNFVNAYPFFDDNRQYLNQLFATSVTIPVPLRGFGAVAAAFPGDSGLYVKGGIYTVYSDDTGFTADSFFNKPDHFTHVELGWSGSAASGVPIQARGPMDVNNFSLTAWHKDADVMGNPSARGVAFNANYLVRDDVMVFGRGGWSEGWLIDRNLAGGFGWRPFQDYSDLFGFGVGWARPTSPLLRDQFLMEVFYRYQLTENLALTPDIQWIVNPALNPGTSNLMIYSFRARLTF